MRDWEKLARACRRYLDAYNDEIADEVTLGSVGNDLRIIAIREVLPQDEETQWAVRLHDGTVLPMFHEPGEERARRVAANASRPVSVLRRQVGPWEVAA